MRLRGDADDRERFYPLFLRRGARARRCARAARRWRAARRCSRCCGLAFLTRAQAVALVPALARAAPARVRRARGRARAARASRPLYGIVGGARARRRRRSSRAGARRSALLGAYAPATTRDYSVGDVAHWLALARRPSSTSTSGSCRSRRCSSLVRSLPRARRRPSARLVAGRVAARRAGSSSRSPPSRRSRRAADRGAEPLLRRAAPPDRAARAGSSAGCRGRARRRSPRRASPPRSAGAIPFERLIDVERRPDTLALLPLWSAAGRGHDPARPMRWARRRVALAARRGVPARAARATRSCCRALVLASTSRVALEPVERAGIQHASVGALFRGSRRRDRDWIDRAVGPRRPTSPSSGRATPTRYSSGQNEFFNRSVRPSTPRRRARHLAETEVAVDRGTACLRDRRRASACRTCSPTAPSRSPAARVARDPTKGMMLCASRSRCASGDRASGALPTTRGPAGASRTRAFGCRGRPSLAVLLGATRPLPAPAARPRVRRRPPGRRASAPAARRRACRCASGGCDVRYRVGRTRRAGTASSTTRRDARHPLPRASTFRREDRVRRQPALARADRASATTSSARSRGLVEAAAGADDEVVPFAPTSPRGTRASRERSPGSASSRASSSCRRRTTGGRRGAASPARRRSASSAGSTSSTTATGCTRRSARGVRSTMIHDLVPLRFPEWVTPRTRRCTGASTGTRATCDTVFVNSAYTGRDVVGAARRRRASACTSRSPGVGRISRRRRARRLGAPYVLTVATLEPRKNLDVARRRAPAPAAAIRARGRRRRGLGRAAAARRARDRAARLRRRRRARAALPRRRGRRLSVSLRGLRHADRRGDGVRRPGRRVGARVAGRGRGRRGAARRPRRPEEWRERSRRRASAATSSSRAGSRTRAASRGGASASHALGVARRRCARRRRRRAARS